MDIRSDIGLWAVNGSEVQPTFQAGKASASHTWQDGQASPAPQGHGSLAWASVGQSCVARFGGFCRTGLSYSAPDWQTMPAPQGAAAGLTGFALFSG